MDKTYDLVNKSLGERIPGAPGAIGDPLLDIYRKTVVDNEAEKMKQQQELSKLEHEAKKRELEKKINSEDETSTNKLHKTEFELMGEKLKSELKEVVEKKEPRQDAVEKAVDGFIQWEKLKQTMGGGDKQEDSFMKQMALKAMTFMEPAAQAKAYMEWKQIFAGGEDKGKGEKPPELPASVMLQIEQMRGDREITLEQMRDDRSRKDHEFELRIKQWDIARADKKEEIAAKIAIEEKKINTLTSLPEIFAKAGVKAVMESGGQVGQRTQAASGGIQAITGPEIVVPEGEFGEIPCQKCGTSIPIATDATKAFCLGCNTLFPVRRTKANAESKDPIPASGEEE